MKYEQNRDGTFAITGLTFKQYTALVQHITAQKMMFRWSEEDRNLSQDSANCDKEEGGER